MMEKGNKEKQRRLAKAVIAMKNRNKLIEKYSQRNNKDTSQNQMNVFINREHLTETITNKLNMLHWPINQNEPLLPQLMLSIFNPETLDNLPLSMYDRDEMFLEVISLLQYPETEVEVMLDLDEDAKQELALNLSKANTAEKIRELLIMDILCEAMCNALDHFPNKNHMRINSC
jgi:hypothetical protein